MGLMGRRRRGHGGRGAFVGSLVRVCVGGGGSNNGIRYGGVLCLRISDGLRVALTT